MDKNPILKPLSMADYTDRDVGMYFIQGSSYVPFYDSKKRKRVAKIVGIEKARTVMYRAINKSHSGMTENTFKKNVKKFEVGKIRSKFVKDLRGNVYVLSPKALRTVDKSLTGKNFTKLPLRKTGETYATSSISPKDYSLIYDFFWGDNSIDDLDKLDLNKDHILSESLAYCSEGFVSLLGIKKIKVQTSEDLKKLIGELNVI